jgi:hypothetical protein
MNSFIPLIIELGAGAHEFFHLLHKTWKLIIPKLRDRVDKKFVGFGKLDEKLCMNEINGSEIYCHGSPMQSMGTSQRNENVVVRNQNVVVRKSTMAKGDASSLKCTIWGNPRASSFPPTF